MVTEMIHHEHLDETLNQSFSHRSRLDPFVKALIEKIVDGPGFIAPIAAFLNQRVINVVMADFN